MNFLHPHAEKFRKLVLTHDYTKMYCRKCSYYIKNYKQIQPIISLYKLIDKEAVMF